MILLVSVPAHVRRLAAAGGLALWSAAGVAGEFQVRPVEIIETKAVYGRVETRNVVAARARIGGTLVDIAVTEGVAVSEGQKIATVVDDKLALQIAASDARIRAAKSELANNQAEFDRTRALIDRGVATQQRADQTRMQLDVARNQVTAAEAERAVLMQQGAEGSVLAPVSGRIIKAPITKGSVVMPGEPIASVAGGGFFLRLALPERHAATLQPGADVAIGAPGSGDAATGKLVKIFPQIENGRVIADVEMASVGTFFTGSRVLVQVPVGKRNGLVVPKTAVETRSGVDFVRLATAAGPRDVAVVPGGAARLPDGSVGVEILTGLTTGDVLITP